jgi:hypothetical protein
MCASPFAGWLLKMDEWNVFSRAKRGNFTQTFFLFRRFLLAAKILPFTRKQEARKSYLILIR